MVIPDLGQLTRRFGRDAVHMAVIPVTAGERLHPGAPVSLSAARTAVLSPIADAVGVVDPFLPDFVEKGQRVWLLLKPGTITGLRHDWSHPAFPSSTDATPEEREESEAWLRDFIGRAEHFGSSFEEEIENLINGQGACVYGREPDVYEPDAEFWRHLERFIGAPVQRTGNEYFVCQC